LGTLFITCSLKFILLVIDNYVFVCLFPNQKNKKAENEQAPIVQAIYPTSDTLPENSLRFYVQFSTSMKAVNNLENIKLAIK